LSIEVAGVMDETISDFVGSNHPAAHTETEPGWELPMIPGSTRKIKSQKSPDIRNVGRPAVGGAINRGEIP